MNRTRLLLLFMLTSGMALGGCTSYYGAANIQSEPSGVQVYDMEDGYYIGITPVKHVWKSSDGPRKFMNIRMQKEGYEDMVSTFWLNLNSSSSKNASDNPQPVKVEMKQSTQ